MKKVIMEKEEMGTVFIDDLVFDDIPYVGTIDTERRKGFFMKLAFDEEEYKHVCKEQMIAGNGYLCLTHAPINNIKQYMKICTGFYYFVFDTEKELLAWLAED